MSAPQKRDNGHRRPGHGSSGATCLNCPMAVRKGRRVREGGQAETSWLVRRTSQEGHAKSECGLVSRPWKRAVCGSDPRRAFVSDWGPVLVGGNC